MSRIPPGPAPGQYPPPPISHQQQQQQHHHQQQQHNMQQQQMYYSPPQHGGQMYAPQGGEGAMYAQPPAQHQFNRSAPPPTPMQMTNGGGQGQGQVWNDAYGPPPPGSAGHPRNGAPEGFYPPPPPTAGAPVPPGPGWSSVHPAAVAKNALPRSRGGPEVIVKTEPDTGRGRPPTSNGLTTTVPLNMDSRPQPPAVQGGGDGGGQAGPSEFIKKLYKMLEEESAMYGRGKPAGQPRPEGAKRGSVGWGRGGSSFVVWDMNEFTTKVLPQTFRHSNFSSFVRQLNKYGFSKIKHVDDHTGQIKENVWEFTHPNFQAGGKADLDSIKRKAVVPKKGEEEAGPSSAKANAEESSRVAEMEGRVSRLEDQLAAALDELRQARTREISMQSWAREMVVHLGQVERESSTSPHSSDNRIPPRIIRLHQFLDNAVNPGLAMMPQYPGSGGGMSNSSSASTVRPHSNMQFMGAGTNHISPMTDGSGSGGAAGNSPEGSKGSNRGRANGGDDIIELPAQQNMFGGDDAMNIPLFADTPAWLTEGTTATIPIYHRKSSDGMTLKLVMETLANQGSGNVPMGPPKSVSRPNGQESQDPLDTSPRVEEKADLTQAQPSPFGSLVLPKDMDKMGAKARLSARTLRRSTTIVTSWTHAPKILVVEDDVVYRQLSSKFLEKFGCVIETVDNAQQAIEKMNQTRYDLVLMDIFFGPSMDGRKATSLIRQFDIYTPIISMTSNAQPQDVDSYLQSGMNDVLAKPFTKYGLFGILEKHLIHLKAIQLSTEIPITLGIPPLSDQGVMDAVMNGVNWNADTSNPLASMGWSDDTYQLILQEFLSSGSMPDITQLNQIGTGNGNGSMGIGTNVIFGDNRKRSIELIEEDWTSPNTDMSGRTPQVQQAPAGRGNPKRMKGVGAK